MGIRCKNHCPHAGMKPCTYLYSTYLSQVSRGSEECVSWDFTTNSWTGDGCSTERVGDTVTCQCSHLTNFAVLVVRLHLFSDIIKLTFSNIYSDILYGTNPPMKSAHTNCLCDIY